MDKNSIIMEKNKIPRRLGVRDVRPVVAFANYRTVKPGTSWGERTIPDIELILVVEGRFSYERTGTPALVLEEGDVLLIPPGESHTLRRREQPAHAVFSCIHGELLPRASWARGDYRFEPAPLQVTHARGDEALHDLFRRCRDLYEGYSPYREELLETVLKEIWLRLAEYWRGGRPPLPTGRIQTMANYLRSHLAEPVTRQDLARIFGVTPEHVNALFRRELGVTPTQFLHRERILRAHRLLRDEGLSVKEAAARVGFDDPFYFSRIFRRILMRTPGSV